MFRITGRGKHTIDDIGFCALSLELIHFKRDIAKQRVKLPHFLGGNIAGSLVVTVGSKQLITGNAGDTDLAGICCYSPAGVFTA